jgi:hypothetical protein
METIRKLLGYSPPPETAPAPSYQEGVIRPDPPSQPPPQQGGRRMAAVGSRRKVWHGTAAHTPGGLTRKDLKMNKWGRIVSRKKSARAHSGHAFTRRR